MDGIRKWIEIEGTGHIFFIAFPVCLLALFIWFQGRKIRYLIPSLLLSLIVINPFFFQKWDEMQLYAYWRILWAVPVIPILATVAPSVTERIRFGRLKAVIVILSVVLVAIGGTFIYNGTGGLFVKAANASKLPDYVVQIADRLLELDDHPRVIAQDPIGVYIRQYSGNIETLFGRDLYGYMTGSASEEALSINHEMSNLESKLEKVNQFMLDNDYDYLVIDEDRSTESLELIDTVAGYGIFKPIGKPGVRLKRNELGQILSITVIDENGQPINGAEGYSTILYEYDKNGHVVSEFRTNVDGIGVENENGYAGYERQFDEYDNIIMERMINSDKRPVNNINNYAEVRREYKDNYLVKEAYFDSNGKPITRIDMQYASISIERDQSGNPINEIYWNESGDKAIGINGYAEVRRQYDHRYRVNRLLKEEYFDEKGIPIKSIRGYSGLARSYDRQFISEVYLNEYGQLVDNINGYSRVDKYYDSSNHLIGQKYYDAQNEPISISTGYAEVRYAYNDQGKIIREEYYDINGEPKNIVGGYSAIEQEYDSDDKLIQRRYYDQNGKRTTREDGYSEVRWNYNNYSGSYDMNFYTLDGEQIEANSKNLAIDIPGDSENWSEWIIPSYNVENYRMSIGNLNLSSKEEGDTYTCQIEVEFKDVHVTDGRQFLFLSQGSSDGSWNIGNVWNNELISLHEPPPDGVYSFSSTCIVNEKMVAASYFDMSFRCDNWKSGMFRIRRIKVEKGEHISEWTPGV